MKHTLNNEIDGSASHFTFCLYPRSARPRLSVTGSPTTKRKCNAFAILPFRYSKKNRGFTIFEMIVAMGIFTVVVVIAVSSLLTLTASERKAITLQNTQDNLRFAMEAMAKEMRTGEGFPLDSASGDDEITYRTARRLESGDPLMVSYRLNNTLRVIEKASNEILGCSPPFGDNCYFPFTALEVTVERLVFYVTGVGDDNKQPKVTIVIEATTPGIERTASRLLLQTTVAQRRLDT